MLSCVSFCTRGFTQQFHPFFSINPVSGWAARLVKPPQSSPVRAQQTPQAVSPWRSIAGIPAHAHLNKHPSLSALQGLVILQHPASGNKLPTSSPGKAVGLNKIFFRKVIIRPWLLTAAQGLLGVNRGCWGSEMPHQALHKSTLQVLREDFGAASSSEAALLAALAANNPGKWSVSSVLINNAK